MDIKGRVEKAKGRGRRIKRMIGSGCRKEKNQRGAIRSPQTRQSGFGRAVKREKEELGTGSAW